MKAANFLVIANKRCGTSWLNKNLADHPEIFMVGKKGVHFFDEHYEKGIPFYEQFFAGTANEKWRGETEHSYFWDDRAPERIHETLGNIPLILALRQPVDRAYSYFQLKHRFQSEVPYGFEDFFMKSIREEHPMVTWGYYGKQLEKYLNYFPLEKMLIIKFEDITSDPGQAIKKAYRFLGVDDNFTSPFLHHRWTAATNIPGHVGRWRKEAFYTSKAAHFIRTALRKIGLKKVKLYRSFSPPPLSRKLKKKLTKYYDDDIRLLMKLTGIDFSHWLSESI